MPAVLQPEKILRDLRELWDQLGRETETAGGVLRACAMTLLVAAENDADTVRHTLGVLMHDHPSRAVVLHLREGGELEARVFAECWMPFGKHQQICAEGIEITAGQSQVSHVKQLLLPLLVPDLPVVLWCRGARSFEPGVFDPLFPLAQKIVFDSAAAPNAANALRLLRRLRADGQLVADLAWTRLTGWREVLAHLFDDGLASPGAIATVRITHGAGEPSSCALYFSSWIEHSIPGAHVTLESVPGDRGLKAIALSGGGVDVTITRTGEGSLHVKAGSRNCRALLPSVSDDALMREELAIIGTDPVFDRVLA